MFRDYIDRGSHKILLVYERSRRRGSCILIALHVSIALWRLKYGWTDRRRRKKERKIEIKGHTNQKHISRETNTTLEIESGRRKQQLKT